MVLAKPENKNVLKSFNLTGKVAAITGGARGIGLEVSTALAEAGADIAIIYNSSSPETANTIASTLASAHNIKATAYRADVSDQSSISAIVQQIATDFSRLDIIVVNSGIVSNIPAEEYTPDQWREIMKVNLDGAFWTAQAAAQIFRKQGHGNVIFTASVSATLVNVPQRQAAYNASKAGVVQLAKCLAVEWVDFCRVNCISPGFIETEILDIHPQEWREKWFSMIPAQRMADAYELKGAYVFCASDASSYMTGANLVIDGGYTLP
ncbi:oxidoreductase [Aspergillus japonicus CBS 114.51]|uniref:Oxidoreductase n=2 Tax=Aspergillus TaxID=5052 RepID=A0A2V5IJX6_ASPV1|nr:oxidoreductase [Aspergillus japonicus CBS 114.51]PYI20086.1 oxidoreductase [Aspergillus violaceofuscus CBS 115571]RAH86988.1 oxidoreductase [Aspergillus japonicus CBS 114.51]